MLVGGKMGTNGKDLEPEGKAKKPRDSSKAKHGHNGTPETETPYVVGIGGSAGGLEAFERLFANMPTDTGMAFVVIQHLDPNHKALMPELLQRATEMRVVEIENGTEVEPNQVFVLPPGYYVSIQNGRLWLSPPTAPHGTRAPVDFFFQSLAADRKEKGIGIIVSGMGMDGTLGLKAIKEQLGLAMVQSPSSAGYDSMPKSAIATGIVDYVAPVENLPAMLISYVQYASHLAPERPVRGVPEPSSLQNIISLLRTFTGHDFSLYKKGTLYRRIERRMSINHLESIADYVWYIKENPNEANALFKDLFIGVTSFFRDTAAFEILQRKVFPELLGGKTQDDTVRIWVVGCSTGEEVYSIVMTLQESLDKMPGGLNIKIQVFATDIDSSAIDAARKGIFPASTVGGVSDERLERFFIRTDDSYQIKKDIRETVIFAQHNIITDPPFTKLDMVSCRNLLIYFAPELQTRLIPVFHYALNPDGILFLGSAETISGHSNLFSTVDSKWKVFKRKEYSSDWTVLGDLRTSLNVHYHPEPIATEKKASTNVSEIAQRVILDDYAPAAVVIDENGDILYVSGRTGKYLELPAGKISWNLSAMAREGLRYELAAAIRRATTEKSEVIVNNVSVTTDGGNQIVRLTVRPFSQPEGLSGLLLVVFEDVVTSELTDVGTIGDGSICPHCPELEQELKRTKEYLQTTIDEMQSSQEELRSTNEEFQSTNEELQSTNEELMTSKEEMQSLNEELTSVNTELQMKNDELTGTNNDMVNLLNSTEIATIFLDTHLNIRRFTPSVTGIVGLRQPDIGRPAAEIAPNFMYDGLVSDARAVLDTLATKTTQVQTMDGRWFNMRIMPYRTVDNVIEGVVVTFSDVTASKRIQDLSDALNDINVAMRSTLNFSEIMGNVVAETAEALGVESAGIALRENDQWIVRYVHRFSELAIGTKFTDDDIPQIALASKEKRPIAVNDIQSAKSASYKTAERYGIRAFIAIPLFMGDAPIGVLLLNRHSGPVAFGEAEIDFANKLGVSVSLALENVRLYEVEHEAKTREEEFRAKLQGQHGLLQQALLPTQIAQIDGYKVAARFVPGTMGEQIGGDFYDIIKTKEGMAAILIGDVSGKGVEAASLAAATRSTIRAFAYDIASPGTILTHTNSVIQGQDPESERFATVFLVVLDPKSGKLHYSGAGHPPAMIRRADGTVEMLNSKNVPVRLVENVDYNSMESYLDPGDRLVMYTDGISESHKDASMYGTEGITETLEQQGHRTPEEILDKMFSAASGISDGALADDAAVIIVERCDS